MLGLAAELLCGRHQQGSSLSGGARLPSHWASWLRSLAPLPVWADRGEALRNRNIMVRNTDFLLRNPLCFQPWRYQPWSRDHSMRRAGVPLTTAPRGEPFPTQTPCSSPARERRPLRRQPARTTSAPVFRPPRMPPWLPQGCAPCGQGSVPLLHDRTARPVSTAPGSIRTRT